MAIIKNITMVLDDVPIPATTDTIDITAGKDILFEFIFECKQGESTPKSIVYNLYTNIVGRTEVIASAENSVNLTGNRLTLSCPEQYAGTRLSVSFAVEGGNPSLPLPGIVISTVKHLMVKSAIADAPMIKNVYWAESGNPRYGTESTQRSNIKGNEDAFLHIHTRGLFGKKVKVELKSADSFSVWGGASTQGTVLQSRTYTIQDNVLGVVVPMSAISCRTDYCQLKAVVSSEQVSGSFESNPLILDKHNNADSPTRSESNLGTSKFVIGDPPKREIKIPEAPPESINPDLNVVFGTLSFLSGAGTLQNTIIKAAGENVGSTYYTYTLNTYELKLQHFIDAGVITESEVIETVAKTDAAKKISYVKQLKTSKIYKVSHNGTDIYGFKASFKNTVRDRLSVGGNKANGLDYVRLRLLLAAVQQSEEQTIDSREFCRSAWQLGSNNRYKQDPFRYSSNHECPPGAFYLVPCPGSTKYITFVSDQPTDASISRWTCTTLTDDETQREIIKKPDRTVLTARYTTSLRTGIALHRGKCTASIGCITLDIAYSDVNTSTELEFFNCIFSGVNGEYNNKTIYYRKKKDGDPNMSPTGISYGTNPAAILKTGAIQKLHLIMIEERCATLRDDVSKNDFHPKNRYKGI